MRIRLIGLTLPLRQKKRTYSYRNYVAAGHQHLSINMPLERQNNIFRIVALAALINTDQFHSTIMQLFGEGSGVHRENIHSILQVDYDGANLMRPDIFFILTDEVWRDRVIRQFQMSHHLKEKTTQDIPRDEYILAAMGELLNRRIVVFSASRPYRVY